MAKLSKSRVVLAALVFAILASPYISTVKTFYCCYSRSTADQIAISSSIWKDQLPEVGDYNGYYEPARKSLIGLLVRSSLGQTDTRNLLYRIGNTLAVAVLVVLVFWLLCR